MLPLSDRAIQFGDGVFRTLRVQDGKLVFWSRHFRKLCADCAVLGIPAPQELLLLQDIHGLLSDAQCQDAVIKIVITRGESARGYVIPADIRPNRIVQCAAPPQYPDMLYTEGAEIRLCSIRAGWQPALAGVKHLNRLENVLARREWRDPAILEGLLLDRDGYVLEGVMSNLLLWHNHALLTPLLESAGVAGVMREVAFDAARHLGCAAVEKRLTLAELYAAEQVWMCNSLFGLVPVRRLAQHSWHVAPDSALQAKVRQMAREEARCAG